MEDWDSTIQELSTDVDMLERHGSIYSLLRELQVEDRLLVPYDMGPKVRPCASQIHREFGATFKTETLSTVHGVKYVLIRRMK